MKVEKMFNMSMVEEKCSGLLIVIFKIFLNYVPFYSNQVTSQAD